MRKGFAPHSSSTAHYDKKRTGQGLLVPGFLAPGGGDLYYVGVWGNPGETFQLDSRQQEITDIAFDGTVPVAASNSFRFKTFRVSVPVDQTAWEVAVTPGSGDPNLCLRRDQVPNPFNNDAFSEVANPSVADSISLVLPDLSDGTVYLTTYSAADYAGDLSNREPVVTPLDYATANFEPHNPQNHFVSVLNGDSARAGWRYFVVSNQEQPQLSSPGWLLELENQAPGTEIAIRRGDLPGRHQYRQNGNPGILQSVRSDASSTLGFLQHRDHESDVWYVGVYTVNQA
ncbi:MAG: hypothetical protein K9N23_16170, partial [Akkermansiaceae bacterium]|nr:hypothetical protein [Akkermansiaceae bacterium]